MLATIARLEPNRIHVSVTDFNDTTHGSQNERQVVKVAVGDKIFITIPLDGMIDIALELSRLEKQYKKLIKEFDTTFTQRLGNPGFISKAPESVVSKLRAEASEADCHLKLLQARIAMLKN